MILLTEFRPPADELAAFEKRTRAVSTTRWNLRVILSMGLLTVCGAAYAGEPFEIDWHTIDGGGYSAGGAFDLSWNTVDSGGGASSGGWDAQVPARRDAGMDSPDAVPHGRAAFGHGTRRLATVPGPCSAVIGATWFVMV